MCLCPFSTMKKPSVSTLLRPSSGTVTRHDVCWPVCSCESGTVGTDRQKGTCHVMSCHTMPPQVCDDILLQQLTISVKRSADQSLRTSLSVQMFLLQLGCVCATARRLRLSSVVPLHPLLLARQSGLSHLLQRLARVHDEGQCHGCGAVAALPGEAEKGGPEEGAAAHEGRPHVGRHQDEVQELRGQRSTVTTWFPNVN